MSRTKRLLGPDNRLMQLIPDKFQKQQRKDYREEDSMMMYDSNVPSHQPVKTTLIDRIEDLQIEDSEDAEESLQLRSLAHSKSTQIFIGDVRPKSTLRSLIRDSSQPQYKHINSSGGSSLMRRKRQSSTAMHQSESHRMPQNTLKP